MNLLKQEFYNRLAGAGPPDCCERAAIVMIEMLKERFERLDSEGNWWIQNTLDTMQEEFERES